jgi:RHS repeat-associated protein
MGAPADSSFYSMHAAVDNSSYFSGTRLFYFGARYYDPELGVWVSVDLGEQFYNRYGYSSNPVIMVDPDGNFFWLIPVVIGAVAGSYLGGSAANGTFNPGKWDFSSGATWAGMGLGALLGGASGGAIAGGAAVAGASAIGAGTLYGAGIGGGIGFGIESVRQTVQDDFSAGGLLGAWGAGTAVGAVSGAMIGGSMGSSFLSNTVPGLGKLTNAAFLGNVPIGTLMGVPTAVGGLTGGIVGAAHGNTAGGILRGGGAGLLTGAGLVGAGYGYSRGTSVMRGISNLIGMEFGLNVMGIAFPYLTAIVGGLPFGLAYLSARGSFNYAKSDVEYIQRIRNDCYKAVYSEMKNSPENIAKAAREHGVTFWEEFQDRVNKCGGAF